MMICEPKAPSEIPLNVVTAKIVEHANKSDEHVIEAAMLLREARRRVEAGEAGDVKWYEWARRNIALRDSRLRELQRIANADQPKKELERLRRRAQTRAEKHRRKKAAETKRLEDERRELIKWAEDAPLADVQQMLQSINPPLRNAA